MFGIGLGLGITAGVIMVVWDEVKWRLSIPDYIAALAEFKKSWDK